MREHIEAYCTINEVDAPELLLTAGNILMEKSNTQIINYARRGYILLLFQALLQEKITLEQFIQQGNERDTSLHALPVLPIQKETIGWREAVTHIQTLCMIDADAYAGVIVCIDQQIDRGLCEELTRILEKRGSILVFV